MSRLHDLYKVTQQSRKAFRVGKSLTYYKKIDALLENKVRKAVSIAVLLSFVSSNRCLCIF